MKFAALLSSSALVLAAGTASAAVTGSVSLKGAAPAATDIDMKSDPKCQKIAKDTKTNDVKAAGGKLADVFVYVKNAPEGKYKAPKDNVKLDQVGCRYEPKVFGIMVKQNLEIVNSDPTLHNIHAFAKRGEFNIGMPTQGQKIKKSFKKAEVMVPIKCDVHPWMQAYAGVMDHPFFAVSGADGKFEIKDLADGEYEVVAWHSKFGEQTGKVKVAGGAGTVDFSFGQ